MLSHIPFKLVLVVGLEPTRPCELRILSPVRLPFRHTSLCKNLIWRYHPDLNRGMKVLQTFALPLGYGTIIWSGKRGSNPRPQPWQGCAIPLSHSRTCNDTSLYAVSKTIVKQPFLNLPYNYIKNFTKNQLFLIEKLDLFNLSLI